MRDPETRKPLAATSGSLKTSSLRDFDGRDDKPALVTPQVPSTQRAAVSCAFASVGANVGIGTVR